ncbi:MAG: ACT domain-containing protein [Oscillospiraceae bacterium]|nr:ACT domain-containing protein [Oscillospiraceae bacterium]MBQ8979494.1 ACT domain-containing protein [Oscillospiraceae bacterium]
MDINDKTRYAVVRADVLPEIVLRVMEAKRIIALGEEKSLAAVCKRVGLSRSAYYKYRDCVFSYEEKLTAAILSVYAVLKDEPGVLSRLLSALYDSGANVLTLNQSVPVDGAAAVTVTVKLSQVTDRQQFTDRLKAVSGVVNVRLLSEE